MNLATLQAELATICADCGRNPAEIAIVAVTKKREPAEINELIESGIKIIGENRVQEALGKFPKLLPCERHFIGHTQTNKVRGIVANFDCIQSVDSLRLAEKLNDECERVGKKVSIFLQANIAGEASKSGFAEAELPYAAKLIKRMAHLQLEGLMVIGPHTKDEHYIRQVFERGHEIVDTLELPSYSAGMSSDWQLAVRAGATHLRIGTGLFGPRSQ